MNGPVLTLLTAIIAALAGLGVLGTLWPRLAREAIGFGAAGLAGLAALLALVSLVLGDAPATLALPLGLPGTAFRLGLDPLAAFFAVLAFAAGAAVSAYAAETDEPPPATADRLTSNALPAGSPPAYLAAAPVSVAPPPASIAPLPLCLAGLGLAILAADGLGRGAGLAVAGGAIGALSPPSRAGAAQLGVALLAAAAVIAAAGAPPAVLLTAALLGPGALAGLVPLHAWLVPAHRATAPGAALLSGAMVPVAAYAMLRMLFDSAAAAAPPLWWGLPLLVLGAASVLAGGLNAMRQGEIDAAIAAGTVRQTGLTAIGLGIALAARAADLPGVTAMALGAVLLLVALQAACGTLLPLAAGAIRLSAGTRRLDRLGGVAHRMPLTTACLLAGLFGVSALPPGAGFAAIWLLFQALLALPRAGRLPFQLLLCALAAVLGLAAALGSASLLRLLGMACLGRPRTPRAAVADEPTRPALRPLLALAVAACLLGVFVGPLLHLLADAPILALTGTGLGPRASLLGLATGAELPGYPALPLTSLLLLAAGVVLWLRRLRGASSGAVTGPAWDDGFAAPPAWLPFGNPATQTSGAGFAPSSVPTAASVTPGRAGESSLLHHPGCRTSYAAWIATVLAMTQRAGRLMARPALRSPGAPAVALIVAAVLLALCAWAGAT